MKTLSLPYSFHRVTVIFILLVLLCPSTSSTASYRFIELTTEAQMPPRMRQQVRLERDGSTTVYYRHGTSQALNLYFALPNSHRSTFGFTVTIDSLDACICVTRSVYENMLAFTWNRHQADMVLPEEVVYLSWNHWHNANNHHGGRVSFYFSATNAQGFGNSDPSAGWTELSGTERRARVLVHDRNGTVWTAYGGAHAVLAGAPSGRLARAARLRFRLIAQRELIRMHPWLAGIMADIRRNATTPRCDWALNFSPEMRLLMPTNKTDNQRQKDEAISLIRKCPPDT